MVAFQATLELMAQQFPGAFSGYKLEVTESHQRQKADTSGTAKAVVASIAKLGAPISEVGISALPCSWAVPLISLLKAFACLVHASVMKSMLVCNRQASTWLINRHQGSLMRSHFRLAY